MSQCSSNSTVDPTLRGRRCRALNTLVYYGLTYNTPNLDGDMYVNFFIGQMVEIPSVAATMYLIYR